MAGALAKHSRGRRFEFVSPSPHDGERLMPAILRRMFALLLGLVITPQTAWSWGSDGHHTIGAIADIILQDHPSTQSQVSQILGAATLSDAAEWMDCAKGYRYCHRVLTDDENAYVAKNPDHHTYHYTDVPIQQTEYREATAGTKSDDVVHVLRYAIQVLRGNAPANGGAANLNRKEALWVIAHTVGDIHQPLHVGAIYFDQECTNPVDPNVVAAGQLNFGIGTTVVATTGGNDLQISSSRNLHAYWDDSTVVGAMRLMGVRNKSASDFAQAIVHDPPSDWQTSGDIETWPAQWASEILPLAEEAISRADIGEASSHEEANTGLKCTWPATLERGYSDWANQQALIQLGKAGYRLAALLQAIFEERR